jgi:hypothetical protein
MTTRSRPIHCGFETLRQAGETARAVHGYRRPAGTNEQIIARATGSSSRLVRPAAIFTDFRSY